MDAPEDRAADWTQADAERWLLGLELFGIDFGLKRIELLLEALGSPQQLPMLVHVVGSNGKSSVTRMVAAILAEHELTVGAYLSPHFVSFTERVLVGGVPCDSQQFAGAAWRVKAAASQLQQDEPELGPLTQFEALTAIAFLVIEHEGVGAAVIEAGLGGRLDATNVIDSAVQVCTGISLEHTAVLGDTI
ncbi:MAG: bifunctional folylpolyglutamate synthase/dihydrofolate synthase, partial [Actinomycetes bacterium]